MKQLILKNKLLGEDLTVYVGSFMRSHEVLNANGFFTVNLMQEYQHLQSNLNIPIVDFNVPQDIAQFNEGLLTIVEHCLQDERVFFGCFGGVGRTGIVLACLNKIFGVDTNLVYHTRQQLPHALETDEQVEFVKNFKVNDLRKKVEQLFLNEWIKKSVIDTTLNALVVKKIKSYSEKHDITATLMQIVKTNNCALASLLVQNGVVKKQFVYGEKSFLDLAYENKNKAMVKALKALGVPSSKVEEPQFKNFFFLLSKLNEKNKKVDIKKNV